MNLTFTAVYAGGVLRPSEPLPLKDNSTVRITVEEERPSLPPKTAGHSFANTYGLLKWKGDPEILRMIAEDDDYGLLGYDE